MGNNPVKYVDPDGRTPSPVEALLIAADVYEPGTVQLEGGWKYMAKFQYEKNKPDAGTMGIYAKFSDGGKILEYALAFRGTNCFDDAIEDVLQYFGYGDDLAKAVLGATLVTNAIPDDMEVTMIGHSKGGAEAQAAAIFTNSDAITFNPAKLKIKENGLTTRFKNYNGSVVNYVVATEILNIVFGESPVGKTKYIEPKKFAMNLKGSIQNHLLDAFQITIKKFDE